VERNYITNVDDDHNFAKRVEKFFFGGQQGTKSQM